MVQILWKTVCLLFKKLIIALSYDPAILFIGIYPRELKTCIYIKTCVEMFKAALFIKIKKWKQAKCPSVNEWMNKIWCSHTTEYYLTIKRNEVLIHGTTWMNLENICK